MGREVRRVPAGWEHPKQEGWGGRLEFKPLFDGNLAERQAEWDFAAAKWAEGFVDDYHGGWKQRGPEVKSASYEEWSGARPKAEDYMPQWPATACTYYMMYETVTEGTPISPAFESAEKLARWLTDNEASAFAGQGASYEGWLRVCKGGYAPSMVLRLPGKGLQSVVEGLK